jgi:two-component system LytT family response regulator
MDINLGKSTGFEVLNLCKGNYKYVIFTTAYSEYAMKAFDYNTLHYILKPIKKQDLLDAVAKITTTEPSNNNTTIPKLLLENNAPHASSKGKFYYPDKGSWKFIETKDIIYIESENSYSNIHTSDISIKVSKNLTKMTTILNEDDFFVRIHKKYIINIHFLKEIKKGIKSTTTLTSNLELPVSALKRADIFKKLGV